MKKTNPLRNGALKDLHGVIIFSLDTQYRYTAFTDSHSEIMRSIWGGDIVIGQSILDYILREDDRIKARANFDRVLQGEVLILEEEYGDATEHNRSWWENRYSPLYDNKRNVVGVTVFVLDITSRKKVEEALRVSDLSYRSIMDQAADGIFISDRTGKYLDVNRAGCELLGYTREEITAMSMRDVAAVTIPLCLSDLLDGKTIVAERELRGKGYKIVPVEVSAKMLEDGRFLEIVRDIAERKQAEARTRFQAFVMNRISSAIISTDTELRITNWNKSAEILYGWREEEVLGRLIDDVCGTEFVDGQRDIAQRTLLVDKSWRGELKQRHRAGREIWVDASVTLLEDDDGTYIGGVTINHDVTERKLAEDELRRTKESIEQINLTLRRAFEREQVASRTDSLTGAFNRRYFFELLAYEFVASRRYQRPLSLVMFDVDFLKKINDTYGHQVGDDLIKKATEVVRNELRSSDVLARYGGDEFVILLSNSNEQEASLMLERIYRELQNTHLPIENKKLDISISAGIASLQPDMENADQLVKQADQALYFAKNSGRNRTVVFTEGMNDE